MLRVSSPRSLSGSFPSSAVQRDSTSPTDSLACCGARRGVGTGRRREQGVGALLGESFAVGVWWTLQNLATSSASLRYIRQVWSPVAGVNPQPGSQTGSRAPQPPRGPRLVTLVEVGGLGVITARGAGGKPGRVQRVKPCGAWSTGQRAWPVRQLTSKRSKCAHRASAMSSRAWTNASLMALVWGADVGSAHASGGERRGAGLGGALIPPSPNVPPPRSHLCLNVDPATAVRRTLLLLVLLLPPRRGDRGSCGATRPAAAARRGGTRRCVAWPQDPQAARNAARHRRQHCGLGGAVVRGTREGGLEGVLSMSSCTSGRGSVPLSLTPPNRSRPS
jgi:hypothetical protein